MIPEQGRQVMDQPEKLSTLLKIYTQFPQMKEI
jgi:hypothetical protein